MNTYEVTAELTHKSALGGNVAEAGHALVVEPGREAFVRCLGCTSSWAQNQSYQR